MKNYSGNSPAFKLLLKSNYKSISNYYAQWWISELYLMIEFTNYNYLLRKMLP